MPESREMLVHIRTPTYRRGQALRRCLESMRAQSWENWICDVFDDDPGGSARAICEAIGDHRIVYNQNKPQKFASRNIDQCFTASNPHGADYFCVVEDDNYILPAFLERNIEACARFDVELILRNQYVEFCSGTPRAHLSSFGIFDEMFVERTYEPDEFRLSLIPGIGVSNGALFWSSAATSPLEIGVPCTATLQEYMRTFSISEKIHVAMTPLAVWAENGMQTTRDLGATRSYLRGELDLKRAVQILQREAWRMADASKREAFLESVLFSYPPRARARGMVKALITSRVGGLLSMRETIELAGRGWLIRGAGHVSSDFRKFLQTRTG
jgi:hypothetical protein